MKRATLQGPRQGVSIHDFLHPHSPERKSGSVEQPSNDTHIGPIP